MKCLNDPAIAYRSIMGLLVLMFPILLSGCMHTDSKPVQFYRLTADSDTAAPLSATKPGAAVDPVIGLGPIHIPEYLARPQMLIAVTENQYRLSEDHRWAEKLDKNISLALFKALPGLLGTERIVRYPWPQRQEIDYQIGVDIVEFNVDESGRSRLIAQWFIKRKDQTTIDKRSVYQFPASTSDYEVMVKAQSQCLSKLAQDIAETLRRIR
ncbi:MAG: PqiC family protein [Methylovulum sp.]|uniref:PqiC family protein n=1 Tax=Methylovulum sp. TaxID=1916980 RepID=UPI00262C25B5|nr:PqiC family protein [Methylovulum sp.]MDD2724610.1 PqiC family protein [Methylovulum sp.]MDD5123363.1 PqiC family protein [Methylovulum sp.]